MATWHQLRNRAPLYHESKWTVLIDPPGKMRYSYLFDTEEKADAWLATFRLVHTDSSWARILAPRNR